MVWASPSWFDSNKQPKKKEKKTLVKFPNAISTTHFIKETYHLPFQSPKKPHLKNKEEGTLITFPEGKKIKKHN